MNKQYKIGDTLKFLIDDTIHIGVVINKTEINESIKAKSKIIYWYYLAGSLFSTREPREIHGSLSSNNEIIYEVMIGDIKAWMGESTIEYDGF